MAVRFLSSARFRSRAEIVWLPVEVGGKVAPWVKLLHGKSGCYAIRRKGGKIVYVGRSSSGLLGKVLLRHFQKWAKSRNFQNRVYSRSGHLVAVWVVRDRDKSYPLEEFLIKRLAPRDNVQAGNEVPF